MLKRFKKSTAAMPDAAVVLGKKYEIEWLNKAARRLLGLQSPQDIGKPITNFIRSPAFSEYLTNDDKKSGINFHLLEQIRSDFIANVSHELRTPLTVVNCFIETMRDEDCPKEWERPLLLMAQQTARMCNIIEYLLLLSRL